MVEAMPWWWIVLLSGSTVFAMAVSLVVPAVTAYSLRREKFQKSKRPPGECDAADAGRPKVSGTGGGVELRNWSKAVELQGCPWNFDDCNELSDALERIWMPLPDRELLEAYSVLREQLQDLQVARISAAWPEEAEYFAAIYTLLTGAKLFGVAPLEHEVSLQLSHEASFAREVKLARSPPRRPSSPKRSVSMIRSKAACTKGAGGRRGWPPRLEGVRGGLMRAGGPKACDLSAPSLTPFYRIHDGFGSVLSELDLPALLSKPDDAVAGSAFYVYPTRSLRPIARWPSLVKFARVDNNCVVCVDLRKKQPGIVYLERGGGPAVEDYDPLAFAADTVRNIAAPPPPAVAGLDALERSPEDEEARSDDGRSEVSWAVSLRSLRTTEEEKEAAEGELPECEARPKPGFAFPECLLHHDIRRVSL